MSPRLHERMRALLARREAAFRTSWIHLAIIGAVLFALVVGFILFNAHFFGPPLKDDVRREFIVTPEMTLTEVAQKLEEEKFVKDAFWSAFAYRFLRGEDTIRPGGYEISGTQDAWGIAKVLVQAPHLAWIVVPSGLRREQVAELLAEDLAWTAQQKEDLLRAAETLGFPEGFFYPDTYLIPSDQPAAAIAERLVGRFMEVIEPYASSTPPADLSWDDVVVLASIVERESAKNDKALVAGILLNRIEKGMKLQADATLQYVKGTEELWWPTPLSEDKYLESPFNTYENNGLPPGPIASPSLDSVVAVLYPQTTKCLYYLHDSKGKIHCSTNYEAHRAAVNRYLR